jgi:DNA-directed RNA polymerase subunit L
LVENQFCQILKDDHTIAALKEAIINPNLMRAEYALNHPDKTNRNLHLAVFLDTVKIFPGYFEATKMENTSRFDPI